jgi:hypothetical protein
MTINFGIFIACWFIGRLINENALKGLSIEEKAKLIDGFSGIRIYSIIPVAVICIAYIVAIKFMTINHAILISTYLLFLLLYIIVISVFVFRKLSNLGYPKSYINKYALSRVIQFIGVGIFFIAL